MSYKLSNLIASYKSWQAPLERCREFSPFEEVFALQSECFKIIPLQSKYFKMLECWLTLSLICLASSPVWLSVAAMTAVWFSILKFSSELGTGIMRNRLSRLVWTRGDIITVLQTKASTLDLMTMDSDDPTCLHNTRRAATVCLRQSFPSLNTQFHFNLQPSLDLAKKHCRSEVLGSDMTWEEA